VHVEDSVRTSDDLDRGEIVLVLLQQPRHQTGGVALGASGNAVLDANPVRFGHPAILTARSTLATQKAPA
jgi:hypothetical protein